MKNQQKGLEGKLSFYLPVHWFTRTFKHINLIFPDRDFELLDHGGKSKDQNSEKVSQETLRHAWLG